MSSPSPLVPKIDYDREAIKQKERYDSIRARDIERQDFMPGRDPGSIGGGASTGSVVGDVANLLFGDQMNAFGAFIDRRGLEFDLERAKDFWADHPVRATIGFATTVAPVAGLIARGARAARFTGITDELLAQGGFVDDAADLMRMSDRDKDLLRYNYDRLAKYKDRVQRVQENWEVATPKQKAFYALNKGFANTYLEHTDPYNAFDIHAQWRKNVATLLDKNGPISRHLDRLPPPEIAPLIGKYLVDPTALNLIPAQHRAAVVGLVDDLKSTQVDALKEGFIRPNESKLMGDLWFSTTRTGTQQDLGEYTTILDRTTDGNVRALKVPRTSSPNLLNRATTKDELRTLVEKQSAVELLSRGQTNEALSVLSSNPGFANARQLIQNNDVGKAIKLLTTDGQIDFTPESIVFNSVFNQKLLLTNYRMIRDIALDPTLTKSSQSMAALAPSAKKAWVYLDNLDGSDRVRRMVAVSRGIDPDQVEELGWVPKGLFRELKSLTDGSTNTAMTDYLNLLTATYKTAKTAGNLPTQIGNMLGNVGFLMNAGINPLQIGRAS